MGKSAVLDLTNPTKNKPVDNEQSVQSYQAEPVDFILADSNGH